MSLLIQLFLEFSRSVCLPSAALATFRFYTAGGKYTWFTVENVSRYDRDFGIDAGRDGRQHGDLYRLYHCRHSGSLVATLGLVLPSIAIIIVIAHFLKQFSDSPVVKAIFTGLKPAVAALILCAALNLVNVSVINLSAFQASGSLMDLFPLKNIILFAVLLFLTTKIKKHPIVWIALSAAVGVLLQF